MPPKNNARAAMYRPPNIIGAGAIIAGGASSGEKFT
jgi:hypothetical protein